MAMSQDELRRRWEATHGHPSGTVPATKDAGRVGLPPELEAAVQQHRLDHFGETVCPRCRFESKDGNTRAGRCPHRPAPAEAAEQRRWTAHAKATMDAQLLGRSGDVVPVITDVEAAQRDSRYGLPPIVDRVNLIG
jgi:hypothetical protein